VTEARALDASLGRPLATVRAPDDAGLLPSAAAASVIAAAIALVAGAAPLLLYTLSLAAFGAIHVLTEIRYVDHRFGRRVGPAWVGVLGAGLGGVILVRLLAWGGAFPSATAAAGTELALVAALAASVGFFVRPLTGTARILVPLAVLAFGAAVVWAPLEALVVLALLHNVTPVGFLAERLRGGERRRMLLLSVVMFAVVPILIATGWPREALLSAGWFRPEASLLAAGPVESHFGAFVPASLRGARAVDLFSAAVYLQCLHYAAVIYVLPRLGPGEGAAPRLPWPRVRWLVAAFVVLGIVSLVLYARAFGDARRGYGLLAAVHAWLEVPILLLALARPAAPADAT
jgi:hypothetical protein